MWCDLGEGNLGKVYAVAILSDRNTLALVNAESIGQTLQRHIFRNGIMGNQ